MKYKLQSCFGRADTTALRMLKTVVAINGIAICAGCATEAGAMDVVIQSPSPPMSPRTKEITELRCAITGGEVDAAYRAYYAGREETKPEKAYQLFRIALSGTGESEFSKKFNAIVDDNIESFIKNDELFAEDFYTIKYKFWKLGVDFSVIDNKSIISCFQDLSATSSKLATCYKSEGRIEKAIYLQKQAVFWHFLYTKDSPILEEYLDKEIEKLAGLLGIPELSNREKNRGSLLQCCIL